MADKEVLAETDEELIPVETPPEEQANPPVDDEPGDDEPEEDERLGSSEDDEEHDSATKRRRKQRREYARQKRDEARAELEFLRQQNAQLIQRVSAVETHALSTNENAIIQRYQQAEADVAQAEQIFAQATSEGQGEYALQAMRIRDAAKAEAERLKALAAQTAQYREQQIAQAQTAPVQAEVARLADAWKADNPWYDHNGGDEVSALTKQIDAQIAAAGYDPSKRMYWEELTRRVSSALSSGAKEAPAPSRNAPPMGTTREHAPPATRRSEIYVTPERKAAMIEAGTWDDPVRRNRTLKEYREYDKSSAR
jgi:uncharacterized protein YdhG (YjbR/CyaY superfamily)